MIETACLEQIRNQKQWEREFASKYEKCKLNIKYKGDFKIHAKNGTQPIQTKIAKIYQE